MKIPPFIATLGMMYIAKGLALIISGLKPIYFNGTPDFRDIAMGSITGAIFPGFDIPNAVLILFGAAIVAGLILTQTILGRYTFALGSNEEADAPFGRQRRPLENCRLHAGRPVRRAGRRADRVAPELGAARAGAGLRTGRHRRSRHRRHVVGGR